MFLSNDSIFKLDNDLYNRYCDLRKTTQLEGTNIMAHELAMNNGNVTMAYAGATPWHRLGKRVSDTISPEEMLVEAGLNWNTRVIEMPIPQGFRDTTGKRLLIREGVGEDNIILDVVGPEYTPVQNFELMETMKRFTSSGKMKMETAGALRDGKIVWALAKLESGFTLPGGDVIEGYLSLFDFKQQGKSTIAKMTPVRVVCANTMNFAMNSRALKGTGVFRKRHNGQAYSAEDIQRTMDEVLGLGAEIMNTYKAQAEFLASKKMSEANLIEYMIRVFSPSLPEELKAANYDIPTDLISAVTLPVELVKRKNPFFRALSLVNNNPGHDMVSSQGTAWGAFNLVTFAYDHFLGSNPETRMISSTFDNGLLQKERAMELALQYAQAA